MIKKYDLCKIIPGRQKFCYNKFGKLHNNLIPAISNQPFYLECLNQEYPSFPIPDIGINVNSVVLILSFIEKNISSEGFKKSYFKVLDNKNKILWISEEFLELLH